jgi:hypothetical protein
MGDQGRNRQRDVLSETATAGARYPRSPGTDVNGNLVAARGAHGRHCEPDLMEARRQFIRFV